MSSNFIATLTQMQHICSGGTLRRLVFSPLVVCLATTAVLLTGCEKDTILKYTNQKTLDTGYYQLRTTQHMFVNPGGAGGGIAYLNGKWLIISGDGTFRLFERTQKGDDFHLQKMPYHAPLNRERFTATALMGADRRRLMSERFRVMDVVLQHKDGNLQIWVSHHWWQEQASCFTVRVSTAVVGADAFLNQDLPDLEWSTLYETSPCLKLKKPRFSGQESGGKMVLSGNPPDTLYLTVGDHGFNGIHLPALAQDPAAAAGKVMRIDLRSGAARVFTSGHRNPQGLFLDDLGRMWLAEHGQRGGDELNLLEQGKNYGWPLATYGTDYKTFDPWPLSKNPGRHDGFPEPIYAWVPSISVSDLIRLQSDRFPLWKGDLFVGSLKARTAFRMHIREGRAIVVEPILVTKRIRDMAEGPNGEMVLWTDNHQLIFIEPVLNPGIPE